MNRKQKKKKALFLSLIFLMVTACLLMSGCSGWNGNSGGSQNGTAGTEEGEVQRTVFAMNTVMNLRIFGDGAEEAADAAEAEITALESLLERGSETSEIYQLNEAGAGDVSEETAEIISRALEIAESAGGAFDPTIAPAEDLWGFYGQNYRVPSSEELAAVLPYIGWEKVSAEGTHITLEPGTKLDLGGIAKGYLSGRLMEIFREHGVESAIVSLGGNVQTLGKKTDGSLWKVALQDPFDPDNYLGQLSIADLAAVTSGSYQRYFEKDGKKYHHILDPETGKPADSGLASVTIVCEDGTRADGLSTALFVMGLDDGLDYWKTHEGFDVIFVTSDGEIHVTEGLEDSFECTGSYELEKRAD